MKQQTSFFSAALISLICSCVGSSFFVCSFSSIFVCNSFTVTVAGPFDYLTVWNVFGSLSKFSRNSVSSGSSIDYGSNGQLTFLLRDKDVEADAAVLVADGDGASIVLCTVIRGVPTSWITVETGTLTSVYAGAVKTVSRRLSSKKLKPFGITWKRHPCAPNG